MNWIARWKCDRRLAWYDLSIRMHEECLTSRPLPLEDANSQETLTQFGVAVSNEKTNWIARWKRDRRLAWYDLSIRMHEECLTSRPLPLEDANSHETLTQSGVAV